MTAAGVVRVSSVGFPEFVKLGMAWYPNEVGRLFTIVKIIRIELIVISDVANFLVLGEFPII